MIDASIPLTSGEWAEWGDPNEEKYFDYMMQYSPVNNVQHGVKYPSCLLLAGLFDPRVQYWEPAKFAASLRYGATEGGIEGRPVLLKTDMTSGHFSTSNRYKYLKSLAFDYSFLLWQIGVKEGLPT
jgi:oligopeptidase B